MPLAAPILSGWAWLQALPPAPLALTLAGLPPWWYLAPVGAVAALVMAAVFYRSVMRYSEGDADMVRIAQAVREGAYAYLRRQYLAVALVFAALVLVLAGLSFGLELQPRLSALGVPVAGFLSGLCGFLGMKTATNASARTAQAAKQSLNDGLRIAFRAGAVMGLCVTGFALLDVSVWFFLLTQVFDVGGLAAATTVMLSFAMGASLQALFARVGGGIYTKAADVGADLVGKVEANIPEDDARNPAVIADNVGDNVGDVAGMGADLYESYYGSILAAMALGAAAAYQLNLETALSLRLACVPPVLAGVGILLAIAGILAVRTREGASMAQLLRSLRVGVWLSSILTAGGTGIVLWGLLSGPAFADAGVSWWGIWVAILAGLLAGLVIAWGTEIYTSYDHQPTRRISQQAQTGPATVIISGIAEGMISTWIPLLTIVAAILAAFVFAGGNESLLLGVFGVAVAAVGMLSTLAITLATDAYGPIADNAGGNAEMTHQQPIVRQRTDMLDALGNTTAAMGKGFAIGSAALTALALLAAYAITVQAALTRQVQDGESVPDNQAAQIAYQGNGIFRLKLPGQDRADAGLILSGHGVSAIDQAMQRIEASTALTSGDVRQHLAQSARSEARFVYELPEPGATEIEAAVQTAEGEVYEFQIVPASTASLPQLLAHFDVTLMNPRVLSGLFIGVMLVFVFCALTMNAVGRAAFTTMQECRRQFGVMREAFRKQGMSEADIANPQAWPFEVSADGKTYPDYAQCVAISTAQAQKSMIVPAMLALVAPIATGLVLGVAGVMGMLAAALAAGFAVAIFMANAGGAWDNAKKWIETGQLGGKGSDAHKASVVGDTVGDPFKDTSGPSLNILIKLLSIVSVVFAGLIVKYSPIVAAWLNLG